MRQQIKMMPDYQCFPLWRAGAGEVGNVNPSTLPLSAATVSALEQWAKVFDGWLNMEDPASTPEVGADEVEEFERKGLELWDIVRRELGFEYQVIYKSVKDGTLFTDHA